ncbi:MAG: pseudaminic acid synthase [Proteobacteria bacterium]|nr:pseudaminic acid synthase [Pseudomonadota bacterium]
MALKDIKIGRHVLGPTHKPFIVAEMSGNHNQSLDRALEIVDAAASSGAHAVKLQTYTADSMTLNLKEGPFFISDPKSLWVGRTLYDLYQEAATPYEWHKPIMDRCNSLGMECFSTPFDSNAVDFLDALGAPCFKIASFELIDLPLIKKVASKGKPLILSTGMASVAEIDEAVKTARSAGAKDLIVLKCTSSYPASPEDSNLRTMPYIRDVFGVHVGLSDHTMGLGVAIASVALGGIFIEKHFTLARSDGGVDSAFSMEPHELKALVQETARAHEGLGVVSFERNAAEQTSLQYRRSLYFRRAVAAGSVITDLDVVAIRPSGGLPPKFFDAVIGRTAKRNLRAGDPVSWDVL